MKVTNSIKTVLITGANSGIGKETARQLGLIQETEKVILACRNQIRAEAAKEELEKQTNREIFEILIIDVSDMASVKNAVEAIDSPIDAIIMNAGGLGGKTPGELTKEGVTHLFGMNVLGHALLLQELLKRNLISKAVLFAGSEAISGVPFMGMKRPKLATSSVEDFISICDGSHYGKKFDAIQAYGATKYVGVMWLASLSRKHPNVKFVSVSPGSTKGTAVSKDMSKVQRFFMNNIMMNSIFPILGMVHNVEKAAKRFLDGISSEIFKSGEFYASKKNKFTGPLVDQVQIFKDLGNESFQDNAYEAIQKFLK